MSYIINISEACKLFIGGFKNAFDQEFLIQNSIGLIINCSTENPNFYEKEGIIKYLKLNLCDDETAPLITHLNNCINFVVNNLGDKNILIHC